MLTLTKGARCCCCGGAMQAGEAFRWHLKSGVRGGSRVSGTKERHLPAHVSADTCRQVMDAPTAPEVEKTAEVDACLEMIKAGLAAGTMTPEQGAALLNQLQ